MKTEVWVSNAASGEAARGFHGAREKYFGQDWAPPTHIFGVVPDHIFAAAVRQQQGYRLERHDFPEAMYVLSPNHWSRVQDLFYCGGFLSVKGPLAEVLKSFDLGEGCLTEFPIFALDKKTRLPGHYYFLNFGCQKDTFQPHQSRGTRSRYTSERNGFELWACYGNAEDDDIAVSAAACEGPDLWVEKKLHNKIFLSSRLHDALDQLNRKIDFRFARTRVLD
jgi:hypothetical protein